MAAQHPARATLRWMAISTGITLATYGAYVGFTWLRYGHAKPSSRDEVDAILDQFMPTYDIAIQDDTPVEAPAAIIQQVASRTDIQRLAVARALFNARARVLGGGQAETETESEHPRTLLAWMRSIGWIVLAEIPDREVVVGAITRPWEANPVPRIVTPAEFAAFHEPGYVKIATAWGATPLDLNTCQFTIRTRVATTDATARQRFGRYWALLSPGSRLIRYAANTLIKREAARQATQEPIMLSERLSRV